MPRGDARDRSRGGGLQPGGTLDDPLEEFYKAPGNLPAFDADGNYIGPSTYNGAGGTPGDFGTQGTGGGGGAPGTGGPAATATTGTALTTAQKLMQLAGVLANIEGGRAAGRADAGQANATQANAEANIFRTRMVSALAGPRSSAQDAAFGDTLANTKPFSWTGSTHQVGNLPVPDSTGGLSPADFGPNTRQAGRDLSALGASRVNSPAFNLPDAPTLPGLPQANGLDTGLGAGSTIAALLGLYNSFGGSFGSLYKSPKVTAPPSYDAGVNY